MALTLTINGVDMLSYVDFRTIRIQESREVSGSTMTFRVKLYDFIVPKPETGMEVIFADGDTRQFGGTLLRRDLRMGEANKAFIFDCDCVGYSWLLDRRLLNKVYLSDNVGDMVEDMLDDLKAAADTDGQDDHYDDFHSDKSLIDPDGNSPTVRLHRFEHVLPTQAMQTLSEASGRFFSVTHNKQVKFVKLEADPATQLGEAYLVGGEYLLMPRTNTSIRDLLISSDISGVGTKVILKGTQYQSQTIQFDPFIWYTGEKLVFQLSSRPFSETSVTRVRANGVVLTQKLKDVDPTLTSGNYFLNIGPRSQGHATIEIHEDDISNGQTVDAIYNYVVETDNENIETPAIQNMARRTGGDGFHEFVYSRASELSVIQPEDLDEISKIILDRKATILMTGSFNTFVKGWQAGQSFRLYWPEATIDDIMYVITVRKTVRSPADDYNLDPPDNIIETEVIFSNIPRGVRL
jgi:hypothetical protein